MRNPGQLFTASRLFGFAILLLIGYQARAVADLYINGKQAEAPRLRGVSLASESDAPVDPTRFLRPLPPGMATHKAPDAIPAHVPLARPEGPAHAAPAVAVGASATETHYHVDAPVVAPAPEPVRPPAIQPAAAAPAPVHRGDGEQGLVTMFTTLMSAPVNSQKYNIQMNTLRAMAYLPGVDVLVYSKDPDLQGQINTLGLGIEVVTDFKTNPDGMPVLKSMFAHAMSYRNSFFYGYTNGDILFCDELVKNLLSIKAAVDGGAIRDRVLVVGQRYNVEMGAMSQQRGNVITDAASADTVFHKLLKSAKAFQTDAEDYFIATKGAFPWTTDAIPALVVGRLAYDNWIVDWAVHHEVETIDASKTIHAVHQTGGDGNMAGHSKTKPNRLWNHPLGNHHYDHGKTTHCRLVTGTSGNRITLKDRYPFGRYKATAAQDKNWNKPNCKDHPTWRTCNGATE